MQTHETKSAYRSAVPRSTGASSSQVSTAVSPAPSSRLAVRFGVGEIPGTPPAGEVLAVGRQRHHHLGMFEHALQVPFAAALRHEPSPGRERGGHAAEHRRMIVNPVQGRGAEHRVEDAGERQRGAVAMDEADR